MTDQTAPNVTDDDRRLAREWAESIESATNSVESTTNPWSDHALAAARVILEAVPAPTPPTLADMSDEERAGCRRMQADVEGRSGRYVIAAPYDNDADVALIGPDWEFDWIEPECVTPRPDLPLMELPGDTPNTGPKVTFSMPAPTAPALPEGWLLADHPKHGRVLVTRPDPDVNGNVVIVCSAPHLITRVALTWCDRDELTFLDTEPEDDQ